MTCGGEVDEARRRLAVVRGLPAGMPARKSASARTVVRAPLPRSAADRDAVDVMSEGSPSCCAPGRGADDRALDLDAPAARGTAGAPLTGDMVALAGGAFTMGSDDTLAYPQDGEATRPGEVSPFRIDACAVSNDRFAAFADATGHITDAERYGWSFVFGGLLPDAFPPTRAAAAAPWWRQVHGATWRHPEGPQSRIDDRLDHPVVHVSHRDALAYCAWARVRLPTEAEWELAARGGLEGRTFPWGDELEPDGEHRMNVWQGRFPDLNTRADGYGGTCPVDAFAPNAYGLRNATGNVWEWTAEPLRAAGPDLMQKGGSYLCHASYCRRYRIAARQGQTADSSTGNVGFRCASDGEAG
jgi:sulfatase modifying factor 1